MMHEKKIQKLKTKTKRPQIIFMFEMFGFQVPCILNCTWFSGVQFLDILVDVQRILIKVDDSGDN